MSRAPEFDTQSGHRVRYECGTWTGRNCRNAACAIAREGRTIRWATTVAWDGGRTLFGVVARVRASDAANRTDAEGEGLLGAGRWRPRRRSGVTSRLEREEPTPGRCGASPPRDKPLRARGAMAKAAASRSGGQASAGSASRPRARTAGLWKCLRRSRILIESVRVGGRRGGARSVQLGWAGRS